MKLTYKKMKEFMLDYCKNYNRYANDAETMPKMDEFWAADFIGTGYFHSKDGDYPYIISGRKEFQDTLISTHQVVKDSMTARDIIIDEKSNKVVILSRIEKTNLETGEKLEIDGMGCYQLILDENKKIKIKSLDFFWYAPDNIKV